MPFYTKIPYPLLTYSNPLKKRWDSSDELLLFKIVFFLFARLCPETPFRLFCLAYFFRIGLHLSRQRGYFLQEVIDPERFEKHITRPQGPDLATGIFEDDSCYDQNRGSNGGRPDPSNKLEAAYARNPEIGNNQIVLVRASQLPTFQAFGGQSDRIAV